VGTVAVITACGHHENETAADAGAEAGTSVACVFLRDPPSAALVNEIASCRGSLGDLSATGAISIVWRFEETLPAVTTGAWLLAKWILGPFSDLLVDVLTLGLVVSTTDEKVTFDASTLTYTLDEKDNAAAFLGSQMLDHFIITFRLLWPFDTTQAKSGDPLGADVTRIDSYLIGARVTPDPVRGDVIISYASPGPLAPLLGFGPNPPNPIVIDAAAAAKLRDNLRAVIVKANLSALHDLRDPCGATSIDLAADTTVGEVTDKQGLPTKLASASTTRAGDPAQTLIVRDWNVLAAAQSASGSATFDVNGAPLQFRGNLTFASSRTPAIALACP
jgi:hypothetical protein